MTSNGKNINWQELPDAEARLNELRDRDLEVSKIAIGLQMRTKITTLEQEISILRTMRETWTLSRVSRLYFSLPRIFRAIIRKFFG
jgi:hypothetical protein